LNKVGVYALWLTQALEKGEEDGLYLKVEGFPRDKSRIFFLSRLGDTIGHSSVAR
jgi:hypothetical protein